MIEQYKKIGILSGVAGIMFILLLLFLFVDISLGPIQITSISTILSQYDRVKNAEYDLSQKQNIYKTTLASLENSKVAFGVQKGKYEAISDETIEVIKEATMQEEYSIEYMWIRLGNYAKMNNLEIVLIEPGNGQEENTTQTNTNTNTNTNTTESTPATKSTASNTTTNENVSVASSDNSAVSTIEEEEDGGLFDSNRGDTFKIQVTGSYMNVSDFVFAVENDNELRFKLDNISMDYVSGTTIRTTFDVKNMVILK